MTIRKFTWPTRDDYDLAMLERSRTVFDPDIRSGNLYQDKMGIRRYGGANLYICIYRVDDWIVRCFCSRPPRKPPDDIKDRYRAIHRFYQNNFDKVSALIPMIYLEQGITVDYVDRYAGIITDTQVLPIVKIPFIKARSLGRFILDHHQKRQIMEQLDNAWLRMMRELEDANMAHGDLDLTNILVEENGSDLTLKLIDYDNVWIPQLDGLKQTEYGHASFQHPAFLPPNPRPYNIEMDRFSALVIYISLKALAARPQLYYEWGADESDRLLLSKEDFVRETQLSKVDYHTSRISQLRNQGIPNIEPYLEELNYALYNRCNPRRLDDIYAPIAPALFIWSQAQYRQTPSTALPPWDKSNSADVTPIPRDLGILQQGYSSAMPSQHIQSSLGSPMPAATADDIGNLSANIENVKLGGQSQVQQRRTPGKNRRWLLWFAVIILLLAVIAIILWTLSNMGIIHLPFPIFGSSKIFLKDTPQPTFHLSFSLTAIFKEEKVIIGQGARYVIA